MLTPDQPRLAPGSHDRNRHNRKWTFCGEKLFCPDVPWDTNLGVEQIRRRKTILGLLRGTCLQSSPPVFRRYDREKTNELGGGYIFPKALNGGRNDTRADTISQRCSGHQTRPALNVSRLLYCANWWSVEGVPTSAHRESCPKPSDAQRVFRLSTPLRSTTFPPWTRCADHRLVAAAGILILQSGPGHRVRIS
jgi:hypothetical protein